MVDIPKGGRSAQGPQKEPERLVRHSEAYALGAGDCKSMRDSPGLCAGTGRDWA